MAAIAILPGITLANTARTRYPASWARGSSCRQSVPEILDDAVRAADSMLMKSGMTRPDGVIVEKLGTRGDAGLFKGIFARYLGQLRDVLNASKLHPEMAQQIDRHLRVSAAGLIQHSGGAEGLFTAEWHEGAKDSTANFNTQISALILLIALLPERRP